MWSLLDVVVEAIEQDCPRHIDELVALEPRMMAAKGVDLRLLTIDVADVEKVCGGGGVRGGFWGVGAGGRAREVWTFYVMCRRVWPGRRSSWRSCSSRRSRRGARRRRGLWRQRRLP